MLLPLEWSQRSLERRLKGSVSMLSMLEIEFMIQTFGQIYRGIIYIVFSWKGSRVVKDDSQPYDLPRRNI